MASCRLDAARYPDSLGAELASRWHSHTSRGAHLAESASPGSTRHLLRLHGSCSSSPPYSRQQHSSRLQLGKLAMRRLPHALRPPATALRRLPLVLPLVLSVLAPAALAAAAPLWTFQLTVSTSDLRAADFLAAKKALTQAAVQALSAAGGEAPSVHLVALPPPPPSSWLGGMPLALTARFRADSIQAARACMRWFQPPALSTSAGAYYWLVRCVGACIYRGHLRCFTSPPSAQSVACAVTCAPAAGRRARCPSPQARRRPARRLLWGCAPTAPTSCGQTGGCGAGWA